jgi:hypothetical protein
MDLKNAAITGFAVLAGVLLSRQLQLPQKLFGGNPVGTITVPASQCR